MDNKFKSSINTGSTRTYPGADIGSDHDLVMMSFRIHLKRNPKQKRTRIKFDLEKLKSTEIADAFKATIGGRFAPLLALEKDLNEMVEEMSLIITKTVTETLGSPRSKKKPWITDNTLALCDERRKKEAETFKVHS